MRKVTIFCVVLLIFLCGCSNKGANMQTYYFPSEDEKHEGTWLTWPHEYTYGVEYVKQVEPIWINMTKALQTSENVHIIAYDDVEKERITKVLSDNDITLDKIDFTIAKSDDVWVRDTGPIFLYDANNNLVIGDFAFDGWNKKMAYKNDDKLPLVVSESINIPRVDISGFILEGGAVELDGNGTMMATKSSVASSSRNANLTLKQVEEYATKYLGVTNFIWLDGVSGEDITDAHIDGMAKFYDKETIMTVSEKDFFEMYEGLKQSDYDILKAAKTKDGQAYKFIEVPMTKNNVKGLDYKGSYLNYYVANEVLLLPIYNDENDQVVIDQYQKLYPNKRIVPIDVTSLYQYGGMIHCITQQQPVNKK